MLQKIIILLTIAGVFFLHGCKGQREKTGYFDTIYLSAEKEFTDFIRHYIPEIEQILKRHGIYSQNSDITEKEVIQWHIYKQSDKEKNQDRILATVTIHSEQKLYGIQLPEYMYFEFVYRNGQWRALSEDESFTPSGSNKFSLADLTPHVYEDLSEIFLYGYEQKQ